MHNLKKVSSYFPIALLSVFLNGCLPETQIQAVFPSNQSLSSFFIQANSNWQNVEENKVFPNDIGWINVKEEYGAKGDGKTDDTQAIKKAIEAENADYTRPKILYFPQGTYLVSDTLQLPTGHYACCVTFQGQAKDKTIIKLKDNASGFDRKNKPKAVVQTKRGNAAFRHYFRDLTINTGKNNRGAIGIDYISNNRGAIINVAIKSDDGEGKTGLSMIRRWPGPSLIKQVEIEGFDYGIHTRYPEYGLAFEYITLKNQKQAGILNERNILAIRGLKSVNSVPVIENRRSGLAIVLEGDFQGGSASVSAIENDAYVYLRDIQAEGYQSVIKNKNKVVPGLTQTEYVANKIYSLFDSPKHSLKLPVEETPNFHDNDLNNWANVKDYPSIQAAMDSGKSTIYFPMGRYKLGEAIKVPATVKKIVGFESFINLNEENLKGVITVEENSKQPLIIEGLLVNNTAIEHLSERPLVIKHSKIQGEGLRNSPSSGKLFLEDVQMDLHLHYPQNVWARQLNAESLNEARTKISNQGGNLWILGLKTEGKGTVIETTKGGKTELLGTLVYPVQKFEGAERNQAAFINNESSHSLIYAVSVHGADRNYKIQIQETRDGETKNFSSKQMPNYIMPLFVGY